MMPSSEWGKKGCEKCRSGWFSGNPPLEIAVNNERWATLHKCEYCGAFWEAHIKNADIVDVHIIQRYYPNVYKKYFV